MTASGHAIIGAVIGYKIGNPYLSFPIAFASHFFMDKVPHWDVMTNHNKSMLKIIFQSALDVALSIILVGLFAFALNRQLDWQIWAAAFLAQLPDWMEIPYSILKIKNPIFQWNYNLQKWVHDAWFDSRLKAPLGIVTQVAAALAFLLWAAK